MKHYACMTGAIAVAILAAGGNASGAEYSGTAASAHVVDNATGAPVEGTVVVTTWIFTDRRHPEAVPAGLLHVAEAVADARGEFRMPAWGPVEVKPAPHLRWLPRGLDNSQPHLHIFAPGYDYTVIAGPDRGLELLGGFDWFGERVRKSWWDGRTIRIARVTSAPAEYLRSLDAQVAPLAACGWVATPRLAAAYLRATEELAGKVPDAPRVTRGQLLKEDCPDAGGVRALLVE